MENLELLRAMHSSLCIRFGTTAPYAIGAIRAERVGYAQDPCVVLDVYCPDDSLSALVPIVRQRVYGELASRGWNPESVEFTPSTMRDRRRKSRDENESSESYGREKFGNHYVFRFRMARELAAATFVGFGSFRSIPNYGAPNERR